MSYETLKSGTVNTIKALSLPFVQKNSFFFFSKKQGLKFIFFAFSGISSSFAP